MSSKLGEKKGEYYQNCVVLIGYRIPKEKRISQSVKKCCPCWLKQEKEEWTKRKIESEDTSEGIRRCVK